MPSARTAARTPAHPPVSFSTAPPATHCSAANILPPDVEPPLQFCAACARFEQTCLHALCCCTQWNVCLPAHLFPDHSVIEFPSPARRQELSFVRIRQFTTPLPPSPRTERSLLPHRDYAHARWFDCACPVRTCTPVSFTPPRAALHCCWRAYPLYYTGQLYPHREPSRAARTFNRHFPTALCASVGWLLVRFPTTFVDSCCCCGGQTLVVHSTPPRYNLNHWIGFLRSWWIIIPPLPPPAVLSPTTPACCLSAGPVFCGPVG